MQGHCTLRCVMLALVGAISLLPIVARATAQRTFVASNGNDAGPCSLGQPCRSFAAAIANTNAGGEVIVLDSAGYGKVTITQAVSIIAPSGIYAGISVFIGEGITINAGASDKVTLRGLTINGQGGVGGIEFFAGGDLEIDRCIISGMGNRGIEIGAPVGSTTITDTTVERNGGFGIFFADRGSGATAALIASVRVEDNAGGGLLVGAGNRLRVRDSVFHRNVGFGVRVILGVSNSSSLDMARSMVSDNGATGIQLIGTAGTGVIQAVIADNVITDHNAAGIDASSVPGTGGVHAVVLRNDIRGSATAKGIQATSPNTELLLQGNAVSQTSTGVAVVNSAIVRSRSDNMVDDNTTNQSGSVTPANTL